MKPILTTYFFVLVCLGGWSQETLISLEADMVRQLNTIRSAESDEDIRTAGDSLHLLMTDALNTKGCWEYPFEKLESMNTMYSPDEAFRLFNWNLSWMDQTHSYYCFVLTRDKKIGIYDWVELKQPNRMPTKIENRYLSPEDWLGCLYYQIIPVSKGKRTYYTMLGWDGNDKLTTKKIIDVLAWQGDEIRLGAPIFKTEKANPKRVIMEYASDVMVSMRYHEREKRIVHDHVAPRDPMMDGVYSFYGPDMTFDAWNLEKGKWILVENVDIRLGRDGKHFNDPREN